MVTDVVPGLINVNKRAGHTSHDVVALVRRALGTKQVGHGGTLDPAARGVLPVLVGRVTRLARFLADYEKSYEARVKLGAETDTGDDEGNIVYRRAVPPSIYDVLEKVVLSFRGEINQEVPPYSAVKVGGEPLYRRARRGEEVAVPTRRVSIFAIAVTKIEPPTFVMTVRCAGGTYVRALARDIGRKLGVGAYLVDLVRTGVGPFSLELALPQERLGAGAAVVFSPPHFTPAAELLPELPAVHVAPGTASSFLHGREIANEGWWKPGSYVRVLGEAGGLLGIGVAVGDRIKPETVIVTPEGAS